MMNPYTLKFSEQGLEMGYLRYQQPFEYKNFYNKCLVFIPPLAISSIINLCFSFYLSGFGQIFLAILLGLAITSGKRDKILFFEIFICLSQIECALLAIALFETIPKDLNSGNTKFILGMALAYFQIWYQYSVISSLTNGMNFLLKAPTILIGMSIVGYYNFNQGSWLQPAVQVYFLLLGIFLQTTYMNEKEKRLKYITEMHVLQWNTILNDSLGISIVRYKFDKDNNKIQLISSNYQAQISQSITDQTSFISFLRNTFLRIKNRSIILEKNSPVKISLEKISHSIFQNPEYCKLFFNNSTNKPRLIDGCYVTQEQHQELFNFKVVQYYDEGPCLMIIFKPDQLKQSLLREMKLQEEKRILSHCLQVVQDNCNKFLQFNYKKLKIPNHVMEQRFLMNQINNSFLNMRILRNEINVYKQEISQKFKLSSIFEKLNNSFSNECKEKKIRLKFHIINDESLISIKWAVYQCLYNLTLNAVQASRPGGLVKLTSTSTQDEMSNDIITIRILNNGKIFTNQMVDYLPLINPKTVEELTYNSQFKKVKIILYPRIKQVQQLVQKFYLSQAITTPLEQDQDLINVKPAQHQTKIFKSAKIYGDPYQTIPLEFQIMQYSIKLQSECMNYEKRIVIDKVSKILMTIMINDDFIYKNILIVQ